MSNTKIPDDQRFRRAVAVTTLLTPVALAGNLYTWFQAAGSDLEAAQNPASFIRLGLDSIATLRLSLLLDLASYLLILPLVVFVWVWLDRQGWFAALYSITGVAYTVVGATGAAVLLALWPPAIEAFDEAGRVSRVALSVNFGAITNIVYRGLWNILSVLLIGLWLVGVGSLLRRKRAGLGSLSIGTGAAALIGAASVAAFDAKAIFLAPFGLLLVIWLIWFGIDLLRHPDLWKVPALSFTAREQRAESV